MKDERKIREAKHEYFRLVAILNDENWTHRDPTVLAEELGRPIVPDERRNSFSAAYRAFGEAIVDVVAAALCAGVSQKDLIDNRGWLSHNDIRGYIARASRPHSYYQPTWPQRSALELVLKDVDALTAVDSERSAALLRSARTFLRRWCREIPAELSTEQLAHVATMWREEHRRLYVEARAKFIKEIDQKTRPKNSA